MHYGRQHDQTYSARATRQLPMHRLFGLLLGILIAANTNVAEGKKGRGGAGFHLGLGGGYGMSTVNILLAGSTAVYTFKGYDAEVELGLRLGGGKSGLSHDLLLYGGMTNLTSDYAETLTDGTLVNETIAINGGGLRYTLAGTFGKKSAAGFFMSLGGGYYFGTLTLNQAVPEIHNYAQGFGGKGSLGLLIRAGGRKGAGVDIQLGGFGSYIVLVSGTDQILRTTSDLTVMTFGGMGSLSINL